MIAQDLGYDIFDSRFVSDPHPVYARMRREAPIIWSEQHDGWIITRFDDVREVLRRSATFSNAARVEHDRTPFARPPLMRVQRVAEPPSARRR